MSDFEKVVLLREGRALVVVPDVEAQSRHCRNCYVLVYRLQGSCCMDGNPQDGNLGRGNDSCHNAHDPVITASAQSLTSLPAQNFSINRTSINSTTNEAVRYSLPVAGEGTPLEMLMIFLGNCQTSSYFILLSQVYAYEKEPELTKDHHRATSGACWTSTRT